MLETLDPLRVELAEVNQHLIKFGIEYPLGSRGVCDLAGLAHRTGMRLVGIANLAREHGWSGDMDDLEVFLRRRLREVS